MVVVDTSKINSFAYRSEQSDSVEIVEIPVSELQHLFDDLVSIYNSIVETVRDTRVFYGSKLAKTIEHVTGSLKAEKDPINKILLLNAYIKQFLTKIRTALKSGSANNGKLIQVATKIQARAMQIIDYIKINAADQPQRKEISLDSQQTRILFSGKQGEPVSRRDTIRAMKRAEKLWPALRCGHRPGDGRMTMRLIGSTKDLSISPEFEYTDTKNKGSIWQRSKLDEIAVIFGFTQPRKEDFESISV